MIRWLLQSTLCLILCPLLAAQQVAPPAAPGDSPQNLAPASATAAPDPVPEMITIPKNTEIEFITLEAVSSATATKGQLIRLAVGKDMIINGLVVIRKGTLAMGKVTHLTKGVPGKKDGYLQIEPSTLILGNGRRVKLWELMYGEDDCANAGPCWVLWTLFAPIALIGMAINANENRDEIHQGNDMSIDACVHLSGYIATKITLHQADIQAIKISPVNYDIDISCGLPH
jgi:hypothetical protein